MDTDNNQACLFFLYPYIVFIIIITGTITCAVKLCLLDIITIMTDFGMSVRLRETDKLVFDSLCCPSC